MTRRRDPSANAAARARLRAAGAEAAEQIAQAHAQLHQLANDHVHAGLLTVTDAAAAIGVSRVTLSRKLNAEQHSGRYGGGRPPEPDAAALRALHTARQRCQDQECAAHAELLDTVAQLTGDRQITVAAAAAELGVHRTTLSRQLRARREEAGG